MSETTRTAVRGNVGAIGARDQRVESWLDREGAEWQFKAHIPLSEVDWSKSKVNQGRLERRIDEERAMQMAIALLDGAMLPAPIVHREASGFVYVSGVHRHQAAVFAELDELEGVYEVKTDDPVYIEILRRSANAIEGMGQPVEESLAQAAYLVETYDRPHREIAQRFNLDPAKLNEYMKRRETSRRLAENRIDPTRFGQFALSRLSALHSDRVLEKAARLIQESRMTGDQVNQMVMDIRSVRNEEKQLEVVDSWRSNPVIKERIEQTRGGRAPYKSRRRRSQRQQLTIFLSSARSTLERARTEEGLDIESPEHRRVILEEWRQLKHAMTNTFGDLA